MHEFSFLLIHICRHIYEIRTKTHTVVLVVIQNVASEVVSSKSSTLARPPLTFLGGPRSSHKREVGQQSASFFTNVRLICLSVCFVNEWSPGLEKRRQADWQSRIDDREERSLLLDVDDERESFVQIREDCFERIVVEKRVTERNARVRNESGVRKSRSYLSKDDACTGALFNVSACE